MRLRQLSGGIALKKFRVEMSRQGDLYVARMAGDVAVGYSGTGVDVASALEDLARQIRQGSTAKEQTRSDSEGHSKRRRLM